MFGKAFSLLLLDVFLSSFVISNKASSYRYSVFMVLNGKAFPSLPAFAALPRFILYLSLSALLFKRISPAATCFPKASRLSIIGRMCLYRRVRDGYGCFPLPHHHRTYSSLKANKRLTHKTLLTPLRKEVIQPHLPIRLPCYDFTPVTDPAVDCSLLRWVTGFGRYRLPWCDGRCVQDPGTYSPQHADLRLLAIPASCGRVAGHSPNWDVFYRFCSTLQSRFPLFTPL